MRAAAFAYFFLIGATGLVAVRIARRLQVRHRQPYLPACTMFVALWSALALVSIVQHVLAALWLPESALGPLVIATGPLLISVMGAALFYWSSFLAQVARRPLTRRYLGVYAVAWGLVVVLLAVIEQSESDHAPGFPAAVSALLFLLKTATVYGWIAFGLVRVASIDDRFERDGLRRTLLIWLAGFLLFDLALRDVAALVGLRTSDYLLGFLQVGLSIPPLIHLERFLGRISRERLAEEPPVDLGAFLAPLGVSARESEVVELLIRGFSNKEIASRLFISVDTVKKHTYNVYRKLGVQNRVQLSYFVRNTAGRPDGGGRR